MTIKLKAYTGLLFTLFLAVGGGGLTLYVQQQDAKLLAEAARTTQVLQIHAELKATFAQMLAARTDASPAPHLDELDRLVRNPQQREVLARLRNAFSEEDGETVASLMQQFEARQRQISRDAQDQIVEYRDTAQKTIIFLELGAFIVVGVMILAFKRTVLDPLERLTKAAASITYGQMAHIKPIDRSDEVGLLTNALSRMVTTVAEREDELRAKHRELVTTLETMPAAFILVDATGNVRLQNRAATALIGPPPTAVRAMDHYRADFKLRTRDGRELPTEQWPLARALRGETVTGEDYEISTPFGSVPMLVAAAAIRSASGTVDGAVVAFQDVTALRAVDRLKDEFVSIVSHELRTPLTSIRGSLQLVLDEPDAVADPDHRHLLNVALNNCERLIRIINDILDISKIESGRMQLQTAPTDVRHLVAAAQSVVDPVARANRVAVEVSTDELLPAVNVDNDRIVQALVNLMSNAIKFAPAQTVVTVTATLIGTEVRIAVRDRGPGISETDRAKLFQKFQQVDASASRRKGGTGLGLVISKAIVEQHGGRIEVHSAVGHGAEFTIVLPASAAEAARVPTLSTGPATVKGGTILVIDDDDEFRLVIRRHLEKAGYRVVEAREGAAGLHVAREARPNAITVDLMMPGMDGWELLARLAEDPVLCKTPVVIISAVADQAGPLAREIAVLAKPVTQQQLLQEIAGALSKSVATVLIAEDDDDLRGVLATALVRHGHRVLQARDGAEALVMFERESVDLLVLDLKMPNVDGLTVIQRLRESAARAEVPIIVVSGSEEGHSGMRAIKLGANAYLPKPVDASTLARRIEELVARE